MTNDGDRFDDIIDEAARDYNRAPETPRAEMWERIQAARTRGVAAPAVTLGTPTAPGARSPRARPDVIPIRSSRRRPMWWAAGLAATLLLGVAIGRLTSLRGNRDLPDSTGTPQAVAQAPIQSPTTVQATPDIAGSGAVESQTGAIRSATRRAGRAGGATPDGSAGTSGERTDADARSEIERGAEQRAAEAALPYRLAAAEHLAMTEALLVSLRADIKSGRRDTTVASWATTLLGTTRMLLDSPASKDVQMKKLLEDLELVLAQIARLPAASGDSSDLELIDKAVKQRQVLTRLRAIEPRT